MNKNEKWRFWLIGAFLVVARMVYEIENTATDHKLHVIVIIVCGFFAIRLLLSFFGKPLTFDTNKKCIFRGRHLVTRFSDINYIELREEKNRRGTTYHWVRICLKHSGKVTLGYQDTASVAFTIAEVVEKLVHAGRPFSW